MPQSLTTELLLAAYAAGVFPMADPEENDQIYWFDPDPRAILPLETFTASRSLSRVIRQGHFEVSTDRSFEEVIRACADRDDTWISEEIIRVYLELHHLGHAHSVECWSNKTLAGGLYGVGLRGIFCGESMFHREKNASKVALAHLIGVLNKIGFVLLDIQFMTDHFRSMGAIEIPSTEYHDRLDAAMLIETSWI